MAQNVLNKLAKISGNAAKTFLGIGSGAILTSNILPSSSYRGMDTPFGNSGWLFNAAGSGLDVHFSFNGLEDVVRAYENCPPVYSIINKQAYAYVNGKTFITNTNGKAKNKESNTEFANKVRSLLYNPNALQNGKQFEAQAMVYLRLFGYCVILPIKPSGFLNSEATALWIIPPYMCEFTYAKQTFYNLKRGFISGIKVTYGNEVSNLNPDDVIILRDITPGFKTLFLPESPIKPIRQNISNLIGIYESKGMLINYRGALGIFTPEIDPNGAIPPDPGEDDDWQNDMLRYGLKSGQRKFIVAPAALKWQQIGISYKDLMLTEWTNDDTMVIADALNFPFKLLSNTASSSMNGTEADAHEKRMYQGFIIPFAEMIYEQWNEAFQTEENNCIIEKDFSHITVIQDDKLSAGRALQYANTGAQIQWLNNIITANQWLTLTELDEIGPEGDKYYYQWLAEGKVFGSGPKGVGNAPVDSASPAAGTTAATQTTQSANN